MPQILGITGVSMWNRRKDSGNNPKPKDIDPILTEASKFGLKHLKEIDDYFSTCRLLSALLNPRPLPANYCAVQAALGLKTNSFDFAETIIYVDDKDRPKLLKVLDSIEQKTLASIKDNDDKNANVLEFKRRFDFVRKSLLEFKQNHTHDFNNDSEEIINSHRKLTNKFSDQFQIHRRSITPGKKVELSLIYKELFFASFNPQEIPDSQNFGDSLHNYSLQCLNEADTNHERISTLVSLYIASGTLQSLGQNQWCKSNLTGTIFSLKEEVELYQRRAEVRSTEQLRWETALHGRIEDYCKIIRHLASHAINPAIITEQSPISPDNMRKFYQHRNSPDVLRSEWQHLVGLYYSMRLFRNSLVMSKTNYYPHELELILNVSKNAWKESGFTHKTFMAQLHDSPLRILKRLEWNKDSQDSFIKDIDYICIETERYLKKIHDVIYPWSKEDSTSNADFPAQRLDYSRPFISSPLHRNHDKAAYVIEITPNEIPIHKNWIILFERIQKALMIDPTIRNPQNGLMSYVTKNELEKYLKDHAGILLGVISEKGKFLSGALLETEEEHFSENGESALKLACRIPEIADSKFIFLEIIASQRGVKVQFEDGENTTTPFKMVHLAAKSRSLTQGDPLQEETIIAWVREGEYGNTAMAAYEKMGWTKTEFTENFPEEHPITKETIQVPYRLIYYKIRKIDPAIKALAN